MGRSPDLHMLPEIELDTVRQSFRYREQDIAVANKFWTVVVVAIDDTFEPVLTFVILGGLVIFTASIFIAIWVHSNTRRIAHFNAMKAEADAEKSALILDNAKQAAKAERELNDFIAHEVSQANTAIGVPSSQSLSNLIHLF